jgi:hypothetical protein
MTYDDYNRCPRVFIYDQPFVGNKKSWIKSLLPPLDYQEIKFMKKSRKFTLIGKANSRNLYDNYYNLLNLKKYPKHKWRNVIKEFQSVLQELTKTFIDVDAAQIPQDWLDARKKKRVTTSHGGTRRVKLQGEINCRIADMLQRYVHGKSSKLTPTVLKVEEIASTKALLVYGREKDAELIDGLYSVTDNKKQPMKFFVLSEREYKVAESLDLHNLISIEKFMEGKNKPFKRIVTGYLIKVLIDKYKSTWDKKTVISKVSKSLYDKLNLLENYRKANYNSYCDEKIYSALLEVARDKNLFDETIYTEYNQVRTLLEKHPFIDKTLEVLPHYPSSVEKEEAYEPYLKILTDQFKYHKERIDYTNYKLVVLNEDAPLEEPLDQEKINELEVNL